jgi:hypothetical protein
MPPVFLPHIQETILEILSHPQLLLTGLSPSMVILSRILQVSVVRIKRKSTHHISNALLQKIQFALCCVESPLLTASQLISSPSGTEMFHFPEFSILSDLM